MKDNFECQRCGKCCRRFSRSLEATEEDLIRWKKEKRNDILAYILVCVVRNKEVDWIRGDEWKEKDAVIVADLWFDPNTEAELIVCPFLKKEKDNRFVCLIHDTKPGECKVFPFDSKGNVRKDIDDVCYEVRRLLKTND